jgi:hypothetical protein
MPPVSIEVAGDVAERPDAVGLRPEADQLLHRLLARRRRRIECCPRDAEAPDGVLSFVTARRRHEVGIRVALGATRFDIIRLVVGGGAFPVFIGILVGLGGAIGLARFIQSMLFATDPIDPLTLAGVSVLFAAIALMACIVPAWRAARVDPMAALRQE